MISVMKKGTDWELGLGKGSAVLNREVEKVLLIS